MEYRIETTGHLTNEEIGRAVDAFLNPGSGPSPGFYPHSGPIDQPLPGRQSGFRANSSTHSTGRESTIGPSGLPKPGLPFGTGPASSFGRASTTSQPRPPTVRFVPISDWGGTERYYFWTDTRRLLTTGRRGSHPQWNHLMGNWQRPIAPYAVALQPPGGPAQVTLTSRSGKPVSQLSDTEKLVEAMQRSLLKIPDHLKKAVEELLTPANIAVFVGLTVVLMSSGGGRSAGHGVAGGGGRGGRHRLVRQCVADGLCLLSQSNWSAKRAGTGRSR